jgi:hypothetical protein
MLYFRLAAKSHLFTPELLDLPLLGDLLLFLLGSHLVLLFLHPFLASSRARLASFFRRFCSVSALFRCFLDLLLSGLFSSVFLLLLLVLLLPFDELIGSFGFLGLAL